MKLWLGLGDVTPALHALALMQIPVASRWLHDAAPRVFEAAALIDDYRLEH